MRLLRVHPRGRLVKQQQPRPGGHRAGDLQPPPVRVGEAVGGLVPAVAHQPLAEERQHLLGEGVDLTLLAPGAGVRKIDSHGIAFVAPYVAAITFSLTVMFGTAAGTGTCARSRAA